MFTKNAKIVTFSKKIVNFLPLEIVLKKMTIFSNLKNKSQVLSNFFTFGQFSGGSGSNYWKDKMTDSLFNENINIYSKWNKSSSNDCLKTMIFQIKILILMFCMIFERWLYFLLSFLSRRINICLKFTHNLDD